MRKCTSSISCCPKLGEVVRDIMFSDSSVHSAVFRIVCTTTATLEVDDADLIPYIALDPDILFLYLTLVLRSTLVYVPETSCISFIWHTGYWGVGACNILWVGCPGQHDIHLLKGVHFSKVHFLVLILILFLCYIWICFLFPWIKTNLTCGHCCYLKWSSVTSLCELR